jgi:hypothetical protein
VITALAFCHKDFAAKNPILYRIYALAPVIAPDLVAEHRRSPYMYQLIMKDYPIPDMEKLYLYRMLRSMVYGFISLEDGGYFGDAKASRDESFQYMLVQFLRILPDASKEGEANGAATN